MDGVIFPFSPPFRLPYIDMDGGRQILGSLYTGKKLFLAKELPKIHQKTILLSNIEIFTFDNFYGPKKWRNYLYILYFNTISWTKKTISGANCWKYTKFVEQSIKRWFYTPHQPYHPPINFSRGGQFFPDKDGGGVVGAEINGGGSRGGNSAPSAHLPLAPPPPPQETLFVLVMTSYWGSFAIECSWNPSGHYVFWVSYPDKFVNVNGYDLMLKLV